MIAIDTNLLVYAHRSSTPKHRAAQRTIEVACLSPKGWGIPFPCLAEFWSIVTHHAAGRRPSSAKEAFGFIEALVNEGSAHLWLPRAGFDRRLLRWVLDLIR